MKKAFFSLILLLHLVCGYFLFEKTKSPALAQSNVSVSPTPIFDNPKLSEFIVYSQVLTSIAYNEPFGNTSGSWLTVKRETVAPEDLEEVKSLPNLPEDLINDFIEKNKSREKLRASGYDVKYAHDIIEQKGTLESFFKSKRKKQPRLEAIIGLSRIGFSKDQTQSLVYVEHFDPEQKLQQKYCLITWKKDGAGIMDKEVRFF
jgi:hypothetical protein